MLLARSDTAIDLLPYRPSGMLARSGTYNVRSRVTDDDKNIYCDFEWAFVLKKEW